MARYAVTGGDAHGHSMVNPHHIRSGEIILESMQDRFDYGKNLEKTLNRALIHSYECVLMTADAEFPLSKAKYKAITDREQK